MSDQASISEQLGRRSGCREQNREDGRLTCKTCRLCGSALTNTFLDLGEMPLANAFLRPEQLSTPEPRYPLHARICEQCLLVQVDAVVSPDEIFTDYAYFSSYATTAIAHAADFAGQAVGRFALTPRSSVLEVASNDGYLLKHFIARGFRCRGIEPARNVAAAAIADGVPTEICFLTRESAETLRARGIAADLLVANNVIAHVPDPHDFVSGLALLLKPTGTLSIELPHILRLIQGLQFDTIYHEHYSYFSLRTLEHLLTSHGLRVWDVDTLDTHGGSLRVLASHFAHARAETPRVAAVREAEHAANLHHVAGYLAFKRCVATTCARLVALLEEITRDGKTVVAYGAAAKGNTLLNACALDARHLAFVADASPHKQGRFTPGSRLQVRPPDALVSFQPDYVLILPWNLKTEIMEQLSQVRTWGGRFVVAVPTPHVLP